MFKSQYEKKEEGQSEFEIGYGMHKMIGSLITLTSG